MNLRTSVPKSQKALQNSVKWCIVSIGEEELFSSGGEDRAGGGSAPPVDKDTVHTDETFYLLTKYTRDRL